MEVIYLALLDIPYFAAIREVIDEYDFPFATNSAAFATLNSVSCIVPLLETMLMHNKLNYDVKVL